MLICGNLRTVLYHSLQYRSLMRILSQVIHTKLNDVVSVKIKCQSHHILDLKLFMRESQVLVLLREGKKLADKFRSLIIQGNDVVQKVLEGSCSMLVVGHLDKACSYLIKLLLKERELTLTRIWLI